MAPKNRDGQLPTIVETTTASMVSERQLTDELEEVGDDPEVEINPFGSAARRASLDPKLRAGA